jgi:YD repeat-containing protein
MKQLLYILILIPNFLFGQEAWFPTPDMNKMIKINKVKRITQWISNDTIITSANRQCIMEFDEFGRITQEYYIENDSIEPYERYQYPDNRTIIKDFNADGQFWITYKYIYNDNSNLIQTEITSPDCYNIKIVYSYVDSVLRSESIIDSSSMRDLIGEGKIEYHYNDLNQLIKKENIVTGEIENFKYDSSGRLIEISKHGENPDWNQDFTIYNYENGRINRIIEKYFRNGNKDKMYTTETNIKYLENGLIKKVNNTLYNYEFYK